MFSYANSSELEMKKPDEENPFLSDSGCKQKHPQMESKVNEMSMDGRRDGCSYGNPQVVLGD